MANGLEQTDELGKEGLLRDRAHTSGIEGEAIQSIVELLKKVSARELEIALEFIRSLTRK